DKAEAFRAAGVAVHDDLRGLNGAERSEQVLQIAVGHAIGEITDVQLLGHKGPPSNRSRTTYEPTLGRCACMKQNVKCLGLEKCKWKDNDRSSRPRTLCRTQVRGYYRRARPGLQGQMDSMSC